jgi:hypothetical protein
MVEPELWSKKQHDRICEKVDDLVIRVQTAYLINFCSRLSVLLEHEPTLRDRLEPGQFTSSFDSFWNIEVFEDCEDLEQIEKQIFDRK